jgi:transcriptional regulator with XRE-family HTH domain
MSESASERARQRVLEEKDLKDISQEDIADMLGWTGSDVSKRLHGKVKLTVDDLEALCFAVGITMTEAVRDRGVEFCAEMTPTEMRLLERYRQIPRDLQDAFMKTISLHVHPRTQIENRGVTKEKKLPRGRG